MEFKEREVINGNLKYLFQVSSGFLLTILKAINLFMPGIFFLLVYYLIIVQMPIGQDMIMQAGEFPGPFIWTIISILLWMLFAWYSSRLVSDTYIDKNHPTYEKIYIHFPRIIGYNVAVVLQLAVLNLPTVHILHDCLFGMLFAHNLYYILLNQAFLKKKIFIIISVILGFAYIFILLKSFPKELTFLNPKIIDGVLHLRGGFLLIVIFFIFQIVFVGLVVYRRSLLDKGIDSKKIKNWKISYNIIAGLAILLYIIILESYWFANIFGALAVTVLAFGIWIGFIYLIKNFVLKLNVRIGILLFVLAILYGLFNNPYKVRLQKETIALYSKRPSLEQYFNSWICNSLRDTAIEHSDSLHPFNVYMIIADGGASKSGYWVASVLSRLQDSDPKFKNHILSLAGASGGSVGNAVFYSLLRESKTDSNIEFSKETMNFFNGDFLTSSFARFLGPDLFRHFIPFLLMEDRAALLEESMENNSNSNLIGNYFKGTLDTIFDYYGTLPMLFINTTNLQSGTPGVISNIKIDTSFTQRNDILTLVDSAKPNVYNNIRLSTAVVLGARFPYISPAGEIDGKYFVDGGYFDNSGSGITLELIQRLEYMFNNPDKVILKSKLRFKVIYISNGLKVKSEYGNLHPLLNDIIAPLETVLSTYSKQTEFSNNRLKEHLVGNGLYYSESPFEILNLPMDRQNIDTIPYPMNWVISEYNLSRMRSNLDSLHCKDILK